MYLNDKKNRITLRLNDEQFHFVRHSADMLDVSPSDFLRMVINASMVLHKEKEEERRANEQTNSDN